MQDISPETVGFRLSPQQAQPLALDRGNAVQCVVRLPASVDAAGLRVRLESLVARHEILRTTFVQRVGLRTPQQAIAESLAPDWAEQTAPAGLLPGSPALTALLQEGATALDPVSGPVLRVQLVSGPDAAILVLSAAVAVADETSLQLLLRDLLDAGEGADEEPLQYADYAEWRHQLITDAEPDAQPGREFWRGATALVPPPPRVLFGLAGAPDGGARDAVPVSLAAIDAGELQAAAVSAGVTTPDFLEAAWHALLARVAGLSEVVMAGRLDGRTQPDLAEGLGPYAQRAPIVTRLSERTTFAELLDQVRRSRATATRWQDHATAEQLSSLGGIGFAFSALAPLPGGAQVLDVVGPRERLALSLVVRGAGATLMGELRYASEVIERVDAAELARRYIILLRDAVADSARMVAELEITTEAERDELLAAGRSPAPEVEELAPVHVLFERQARRTPERLAVASAAGGLSYAELDARANRLANHLLALGAQRGVPIGLCLERTPELLVAVLAILKSGAPYLPLNGEHPAARLAHQLGEAGARVVITETALLERLPADAGLVICVDRDAEVIAASPEHAPPVGADLDALAYVMYTSGSTGLPKGVMVSHANLANYALSLLQRLGVGPEDAVRFGLVTAVSTDLGNTAIFPPLVSGGCIQMFSAAGAMHASSMAAELQGERLDALKITPSHLRALLTDGPANAVLPRRWLVVGGEALPWELVGRIRATGCQCAVLNHYGPTEATVGACAHLVEAAPRPDALTVPIGRPLAGAYAHVLDGARRPLPAGVEGELYLGGAGVAQGYIGGRTEDAERFIADPFGASGTRLYRTGDRARRLRDGAIEFLGRVDEQVKIRGFRVEPGEIEAALVAHPAVGQAAVAVTDSGPAGAALVAYLVAAERPSTEELRAFLGQTLPEYMIPSAFATVQALPLTPSGKIDRQALRGQAEVQSSREAEYVAPRDEIEAEIAAIWQELLGVPRVSVLDDFFALGGHSLLATQAIMRIRRAHGDVPLRALLAAPTVAMLAEVVRRGGAPSRD